MRVKALIFSFAMSMPLLMPGELAAYVKSAILEYSTDDAGGFWVNGKTVRDVSLSREEWYCYRAFSTSDGTLPLSYFNQNGDNLLAVQDRDIAGGWIMMSYRLTVNHSSGDPVVIWGMPDDTKTFKIHPGQALPVGWNQPGFDDSAWPSAQEAGLGDVQMYQMKEPRLKGWGGLVDAIVPWLSSKTQHMAETGGSDLYRSHFRFPNKAAKVQLFPGAKSGAVNGQKLAFRIVPGQDVADFGDFQVFTKLPVGLDPINLSTGQHWDAEKRKLSWNFGSAVAQAKFKKLYVQSVTSAPGWVKPEYAVGPEKPMKEVYSNLLLNFPRSEWDDGASFTPDRPGWFKLQPSGFSDGGQNPKIYGVIFRNELRSTANDTPARRNVDFVKFNYSVDGSLSGLLRSDVVVSRTVDQAGWYDGYYDATLDRNWTWQDINNLKVKFVSEVRGTPEASLLASAWVIVKYAYPMATSPVFYAQVSDPACRTLPLKAGIIQYASKLEAEDVFLYRINHGSCPTPVPPPTPIPTVAGEPPRPTPTSTPDEGLKMAGGKIEMGCFNTSPEPFNDGGVYIFFCTKVEGTAKFTVVDGNRKAVRTLDAGSFRAGNQQVFFNGLDDAGNPLPAGSYSYQITFSASGRSETNGANFSKVRKKKR